MEEAGERMLRDARFAGVARGRYKAAPRRARTAPLDRRFASMFTDDKFRVKATVDKRGRPRPDCSSENLRRFYTLDDEDDDDEEEEEQSKVVRRKSEECEPGSDELARGELVRRVRERLLDPEVDYARGEGVLCSDSSSDEESSSADEEESSDEEHAWGELDADADTTDVPTDRLAVCNMDWDNMSAQDILVLFHSFLPPGGLVHSVTIYPSEFGLKRMQEEEVRGPLELTEKGATADLSGGGDHEEGAAYNMERLRRYQLTRLRYYYALVQCDSPATADHLYAQCDGLEYESSATRLDLRFVPPDCTFDQEAKETCSGLPEPGRYRPRTFTTSALQQARVELTWDATDAGRTELLRSALDGQIDDLQLREYLASSSDEDRPDRLDETEAAEGAAGGDAVSKYRRLLAEAREERAGKGLEMEVTWGLGVKGKAERLVRAAQTEEKHLTPFEQLMEKRKEKKKQKKAERQRKVERARSSGAESEEDEPPVGVDMSDPYFAEEFDKPEFRSGSGSGSGSGRGRAGGSESRRKREATEPPAEERGRTAELELLLEAPGRGARAHFSLKEIQAAESDGNKSKRRRKLRQKTTAALDEFQINVKDERFSAVFDSHHYSIDPTDPNYKKTRNMERLIEEKRRRRPAEGPAEAGAPGGGGARRDAELSVLVKSIRRKARHANK